MSEDYLNGDGSQSVRSVECVLESIFSGLNIPWPRQLTVEDDTDRCGVKAVWGEHELFFSEELIVDRKYRTMENLAYQWIRFCRSQ